MDTPTDSPATPEPMQLIVAIVQDEDAGLATDALTTAGFRVTRINTMGGFLRKGNATLAIATEPSQVQRALLLIRDNCERRSEFFVPTAPGEIGEPYPLEPIPGAGRRSHDLRTGHRTIRAALARREHRSRATDETDLGYRAEQRRRAGY